MSRRAFEDTPRPASAIEEQTLRFQALAESLGEAIWELDASDRVRYANRSLRELLGYSDSEFSSMRVSELVHPDDLYLAAGISVILDETFRLIQLLA